MAGTLADMKARIASEIARPDLTAQIALAIADAIAIYAQERFSFSEQPSDGTVTFNTVIGRDIYTAADNPNIGTLLQIDNVSMTVGTNVVFTLLREDPEILLSYNNTGQMTGQPTRYAYENGKFILSCVPAGIYAVSLGLFMNIPAPAADNEVGNAWMTTAEMLIRSRAKFELATHVTRNDKMAAAMSPEPPQPGQIAGATYSAWKRLKGTVNRRTARGIIRPMQF